MTPHPFSLRQLQYVLALATEKSFRKAAERCHVSQPSLSAQLSQLENVLDAQLFERDHKRVLPTAAGELVIASAKRILGEADEILAALHRSRDPLSGPLRLGVIPTISPYLLPAISPELRRCFPQLVPLWLEDKTEVLVKQLGAGELDAALLALEAPIGHLEQCVIAKDPFVFVARADHPLCCSDKEIARSELNGASVLLLDDGHCFREQALDYCTRAKTYELEFRATSLSTLVQMVANGAGVTLLPALAVAHELRSKELRARPFRAPAPFRTIALVWRPNSPISKALQTLAQHIQHAYPGSKS